MSIFLVSCTSNTIYEKPKNLIPKDSMINLLTDMYIATSAKGVKNKHDQNNVNYMPLIFNKHQIDTIRFHKSNQYYTSKIDEYSLMLKQVKKNIDSLQKLYNKKKREKDSLASPIFRLDSVKKLDSIKKSIPKDSIKKKTIKKKAPKKHNVTQPQQ